MTAPAEDRVKTLAYELWERAGKPRGRKDEFRQQAEEALRETDELRDIATAPPPKMLPE